jgi:hypothetical protein
LIPAFVDRGWTSYAEDGGGALLRRRPTSDVEHRLLINEPLPRSQLPSARFLGVGYFIAVSFGSIEGLIARASGHDPTRRISMSCSLHPADVVPHDNMYVRAVYLIGIEGGEDDAALLLDEYDKYVEPDRIPLEDLRILDDRDYRPASTGEWAWNLRRAAYLILKGSNAAAHSELDRLADMARSRLKRTTELANPGLFEAADKRSIEEFLTFAEAMRRGVRS